MKIKSILKLFEIETKLFLREPAAVFFSIAFPILLLLVFGTIFNFPSGYGDFKIIELYIPPIISMIIASCGIMGIPITIAEYKEQGIFKQYKAISMPPNYILIIQTTVNYITTLVGAVLIILLGTLIFKIRITENILLFFLWFSLCCASLFSFGFLLSTLLRTIRAASAICMFLFFPMLFLSGAAIPKELFPEIMKKLGYVIPLSWVVDLLKATWIGEPTNYYLIILLSILFIICTVISIYNFKWE